MARGKPARRRAAGAGEGRDPRRRGLLRGDAEEEGPPLAALAALAGVRTQNPERCSEGWAPII